MPEPQRQTEKGHTLTPVNRTADVWRSGAARRFSTHRHPSFNVERDRTDALGHYDHPAIVGGSDGSAIAPSMS